MPTNQSAVNPYSHSHEEFEFGTPEYPEQEREAYAAPPENDDAPYIKTFGWAPALRLDVDTIPDAHRLGDMPLYQSYPAAGEPPEDFYKGTEADREQRYSVETQDAVGWDETKAGFGFPNPASGANRFAPNPRSIPPKESRITQLLSPSNYSFLRPFMTGQPKMGQRELNGVHFSMADHRRNYEILGMAPQRKPGSGTRNTYRLDPQPWDENIVDMPPQDTGPISVEVPTVNVDYSSRSWRLQ